MDKELEQILKDNDLGIKQLSRLLNDLYDTANHKYLNADQYAYVEEQVNKIQDSFSHILYELKDRAYRNSYMYMIDLLQYIVRTNAVNSLEDLDKVIDDFKTIMLDEPGDHAALASFYEARQFCIDHPDIAGKYIEVE